MLLLLTGSECDCCKLECWPSIIDLQTKKEGDCWQMQVKDFARVSDSIIGWGSSVGRWARIDNKSVIGEDVHVKVTRRCCLSRIRVFSDFEAAPEHQSLPSSAHSNT